MYKTSSFIFYTGCIFLLGMYTGYQKMGFEVKGIHWFIAGFLSLYFLSQYKQSLKTKKENNDDNIES